MRQNLRSIFRYSALGATAYFVCYPFVKTDTRFYHQKTDFNEKVLRRSDQYLKSYMPGFGISGKVRQVLFNVWFAKDIEIPINYERTNLTMSDGGTISVDWATPSSNQEVLLEPTLGEKMLSANRSKKRVVVIFPGLSGGSDRGYVKALVKTLVSDGFEVAVFHN